MCCPMTVFQGIDISTVSGAVPWARLKACGVDFVMLRATVGQENANPKVHPHFHRLAYEATEAGIPFGAYHSSLATTVEDAHREAEAFLTMLDGYQPAYPLALDVEHPALRELPPSWLTAIAEAWCNDLREAGYYPMIRANATTLCQKLNEHTLRDNDVWILQPGESLTYSGKVGIWQYKRNASIPGVKPSFALNRTHRDYPALMRERGFNGFYPSSAVPSYEPDEDEDAAAESWLCDEPTAEASAEEPASTCPPCSVPQRPAEEDEEEGPSLESLLQTLEALSAMLQLYSKVKDVLDTFEPALSALSAEEAADASTGTAKGNPPSVPASPPETDE